MIDIFDKKHEKDELLKYVGDLSQVAGTKEYVLTSGKEDGVRGIDVKTGAGLSFTVLPSRGMDIAWADYKSVPLSFVSKSGVTAPAFFDDEGLEFLRGFYCGLLTTCGLTYMGAPCEDQGESLGLHGRISNIPAFDVCVDKEWVDGEYIIKLKGKVRESKMFGENICLTREIITKMGDNTIYINDSIENCGFDAQPFMLLYHCNFGYPLLSEDSEMLYVGTKVTGRDDEANGGIATHNTFEKPTHGYSEQVFYHDLEANEQGQTYACVFNNKLSLGAYVKFNKNQFAKFGEWKMMGESDYVLGLEPATWVPEGRAKAREQGELDFIQPGEVKKFNFSIGVVRAKDELEALL
jgi:hypothetical protein